MTDGDMLSANPERNTESTIRAHLEAIIESQKLWGGLDYLHAVAALALLDQAPRWEWDDYWRIVPDPGSAATHKEPS